MKFFSNASSMFRYSIELPAYSFLLVNSDRYTWIIQKIVNDFELANTNKLINRLTTVIFSI